MLLIRHLEPDVATLCACAPLRVTDELLDELARVLIPALNRAADRWYREMSTSLPKGR